MAENLAMRRSRRSTAGNRMEAALAEMALDETNKDLDDDNEFVNDKDEEDLFESDFASTDEEANQEEADAGERAIDDEKKSARKVARVRLEKRTAAAHDRNKATFNPQAIAPSVVKPKQKPKQTTTLDTPEFTTSDVPKRAGQKRKSQRRHTILNTSATDSRMRETEEKKASAPKKFKPTVKSFSQAELIQRALDNEEGNIKEHKNYLNAEEEKRRKARVIKMPTVEGPLLRWISRTEDEKFKVQVEVTPPQPQPTTIPTYGRYTAAQLSSYYTQLYQYLASHSGALSAVAAQAGSSSIQPAAGQTSTSQLPTVPSASSLVSITSAEPVSSGATTAMPSAATTASASTVVSTSPSSTSATAAASPTATFSFRLQNTTTPYPFTYYTQPPTTTASTSVSPVFQPTLFTPTPTTAPLQSPQKKYVEEERTEKVTKNYVVVEANQREGIAKPPWKDMMKAMFGDHVEWDELKVLSGKGRPLSRVKQRCPITGDVAPYLDPRTGVPFADAEAYKVLTELLEHEYTWSPEFGSYVSRGQGG